MINQIKNQRGITIISALVAAGILAIIAVGAISLIEFQNFENRRTKLIAKFRGHQYQFQSIIEEQEAWRKTLFDAVNNPNMSCLRNRAACSSSYISSTYNTSLDRIVLKDSNDNIFYDGRSTNTNGFTEDGAACSTFSYDMNAGNDACPIGYLINWRIVSVNPNTVQRENNLAVVAKLVYNPSSSSKLKTFFNRNSTDTAIKQYDIEVYRLDYDKNFESYTYICAPLSYDTTCIADPNQLTASRQCNDDGTAYGPCVITACNTAKPGIQGAVVNNSCVCSPGLSFRNGLCQ